MKKNELMETVQSNKKDKEKGIVLIFIASLLAFAAAVYGAFRFGEKRGAQQAALCDAEKTEKARRKSEAKRARSASGRRKAARRRKTAEAQHEKAAAEQSTPAPAVHRPTASRPVYVVRPLHEKKRESRGKRFKRHMCSAAAVILVISMAGSSAMQYVEPSTVLAKESFSGIGKIVKEHDDGDPYVILDIVPGMAVYGDSYPFSMGTMGYLVNGQAPITKDIAAVFRSNVKFYSYAERENFVKNVTSGSELEVTYEERYLGVDFDADRIPSGWTQLFGETSVMELSDEEDEGAVGSSDDDEENDIEGETKRSLQQYAAGQYVTGRFYGIPEEVSPGKGNYIPVGDRISLYSGNNNVGDHFERVYDEIANEFGAFHVSFVPKEKVENSEDLVGGYTIDYDKITSLAAAPESSYVYVRSADENGNEVYDLLEGGVTVAELVRRGADGSAGSVGSDSAGESNDGEKGEGEGDDENTPPEGEGEGEGENIPPEGEGEGDGEDEDNPPEGEGDGNDNVPPVVEEGEGDGEDNVPLVVEAGVGEAEAAVRFGDIDLLGAVTFSDGWTLLAEGDDSDADGEAGVTETKTRHEILQDVLGTEYDDNYKVLVFSYDPSPSSDEQLYWFKGVSDNVVSDGEPYPYDSYDRIYSTSTLDLELDTPIMPIDNLESSETPAFSFIYAPGKGTYNLKRANKDADGAVLIEVQGAPVFFRVTAGNDWLKQYVFSTLADGDNENSAFEIEVRTVTAGEVTYDDVREADLVFLESGFSNPVLNISAADMTVYRIKEEDGVFQGDIKEDVLSRILKGAVEDLMPVIVDYDIVGTGDEDYKGSNYWYLAKAFLKEDLEGFYLEIDDDGNLLENLKMGVGENDDFPEKKDNSYHYVNHNIYVVNGTPLVSGDFHEKMSEAGFKDVITAIKAENTALPEDDRIEQYVSKARAVQYIINFSVGIIGDFDDLRVLEIQPSANIKSDLRREDGNKRLTWQTDDVKTAKQILHNNEAFDVFTDTKSVVEFNGEWDDINGMYDFIFIGLDGQRLNRNDGETRYNSSELNGKVYHGGDSSDKGDYDANDLTTQKMEELLDYMKAGYPVLVEDNCFDKLSAQKAENEGDINTNYIASDTNMFRFLKYAVEEDQYEDCIFTVSDVKNSTMFMTKVCLEKPRISLAKVDDDGQITSESTSGVQSLALDENNEYHGQIGYRITNSHDEDENYERDVTVSVYVDYNYDGYFADAEKVDEYINENNVLDVRIEGMGHGILPWKLEVSDVSNAFRRDSVQGYFLLSGNSRNEIKVLQITEKKNDSAYDLQLMFRQNSDTSVLGYYMKTLETALSADMQVESVNASQLGEKLAENSEYLEQWDVVVLTLDGAAGSSDIATAISEYASEGRSLLVCGQDPGDERAGLTASLLGQTDRRTFVNLGSGNTSTYQRYADLDGGMFEAKNGLWAEEVNNGIISMYPFPVSNNTVNFGSNTNLKAAPYLLEFEDNIKTEAENDAFVTVWYTLGGGSNTAYGISPKDARNNYYCYSRGNVVYLAQSEYRYTYDSENGLVSDDNDGAGESKFFVNALMAAYSAGLHNAHINIVSGFSPDAADIQTISVPYDEQWLNLDADSDTPTFGILDKTVDVYFRFSDNNFAKEKTTLIGFYYEDENGERELTVDGKKTRGTSFPTDIWTVTDNRLVQVVLGDELQLQPGKIYRIKAPVIPLQNKTSLADREEANKADIYIVLETTIVRAGKEYKIISVDSVSLNRAQLFMLE